MPCISGLEPALVGDGLAALKPDVLGAESGGLLRRGIQGTHLKGAGVTPKSALASSI